MFATPLTVTTRTSGGGSLLSHVFHACVMHAHHFAGSSHCFMQWDMTSDTYCAIPDMTTRLEMIVFV